MRKEGSVCYISGGFLAFGDYLAETFKLDIIGAGYVLHLRYENFDGDAVCHYGTNHFVVRRIFPRRILFDGPGVAPYLYCLKITGFIRYVNLCFLVPRRGILYLRLHEQLHRDCHRIIEYQDDKEGYEYFSEYHIAVILQRLMIGCPVRDKA